MRYAATAVRMSFSSRLPLGNSLQCFKNIIARYSTSAPAAALAEHLQRQHEEVAHARVKATMAPGPAATRRFAALYPYPGAWSDVSTLEMLSACPPTADRTGPDGEALRRVPLAVDVDAEFIGCYGSHGPSAPFGPASFGRTSLAMARLMISHAHGTAIYGRDPALKSEEEEEDDEDDELVRYDREASSAMRALKAAAAASAAAASAAAAVVPRKWGGPATQIIPLPRVFCTMPAISEAHRQASASRRRFLPIRLEVLVPRGGERALQRVLPAAV